MGKKIETMNKKLSALILYAVLLSTMLSCFKETVSRVGFNAEFHNNSQGLSILEVKSSKGNLLLSGNITVNGGGIEINLINPEGMTICLRAISSPGYYTINESFGTIPGIWKLSYKSHSGSGSIKIYLSLNE